MTKALEAAAQLLANASYPVILAGAFQANPWWAVIATSGIVLGAAYMLWLYQRTMFGKLTNEANKGLKDLNFREIFTMVPLLAFGPGRKRAPTHWALIVGISDYIHFGDEAGGDLPGRRDGRDAPRSACPLRVGQPLR